MINFKKYIECTEVKTISDINDLFDYEDKEPQGKHDWSRVSCGQTKKYNELEEIFKCKLLPYIDAGKITKEEALTALCECCQEREGDNNRNSYYKCLSTKLSVTVNCPEQYLR